MPPHQQPRGNNTGLEQRIDALAQQVANLQLQQGELLEYVTA